MTASEVFRVVHAGHDITEVEVVFPRGAKRPLICWTCHEEQSPERHEEE